MRAAVGGCLKNSPQLYSGHPEGMPGAGYWTILRQSRMGGRRARYLDSKVALDKNQSKRNQMTVRTESNLEQAQKTAREKLDAWVREIVAWHFDPATGTPFWLDRAKSLGFDPRREIQNYDDLDRFGFFEDEWLRGGPVRRWVPKAYSDRPVYTFETGGSTGVPKSRISIEDFRIDFELFSETLPDDAFPKGADWLS